MVKLTNLSRHARSMLLFGAAVAGALFYTSPILAQTITWEIVPGTGGVSSMYPQGSDPDLFGANTVVRRGDRVNFDAEIDKQYVRYSGNCRTRQLFILKTGILDSTQQPRRIVQHEKGSWFTASLYQEKFLTKACGVNR
ncbi:hypothetical protein NIES2135_66180 (plasmid) [Leptolyngbya boryana NIES-2135]|jgi:hypothetical protein|uniref:Uncharacterized protein n=2 Tax=Leptolyngbya group TaxID=3081713 RepID=A0A1Z4JSJ3_LEPBY|nr:hypothetical protein NIES2135_66180 [Leptolyngbya boryana NIES-2135]